MFLATTENTKNYQPLMVIPLIIFVIAVVLAVVFTIMANRQKKIQITKTQRQLEEQQRRNQEEFFPTFSSDEISENEQIFLKKIIEEGSMTAHLNEETGEWEFVNVQPTSTEIVPPTDDNENQEMTDAEEIDARFKLIETDSQDRLDDLIAIEDEAVINESKIAAGISLEDLRTLRDASEGLLFEIRKLEGDHSEAEEQLVSAIANVDKVLDK